MVAHGPANGHPLANAIEPKTEQQAERVLTGEPLSLGYRPSVPVWMLLGSSGAGMLPYHLIYWDVEAMIATPAVLSPYSLYKSGIANVEFEIRASDSKAGEFAERLYQRFWERDLDTAQHSWDYGWGGVEANYRVRGGLMTFEGLSDLHPLDVYALTLRGRYCGFSIHGELSAQRQRGDLRLWGPGRWPAKGVWFTHARRFHRWYGRSQLLGAWRPWRRLSTRDGAEEVIDGGFYRFAYRGPEVRYPPEDFAKKGGGIDYDAAQAKARQMAEQAKAGFSVALPNTRDKDGNPKWEINWPEQTLNLNGLIEYQDVLKKEISLGVGVPPELIEASETGSGWSGRKIPMLGFYTQQLRNAREIVRAVHWQILTPLLRWNFGPGAWAEVQPKLVLPADLAGDTQGGAQAPGGAPGMPPGQPEAQGSLIGPGSAKAPATGAAPPPGGASPWQPYQGKQGGRGWRNTATGQVVYGDRPGATLATEPDEGFSDDGLTLADDPNSPWQPYQGKRGGQGWRNTVTGRIVYQANRPGMRAPKAAASGKGKAPAAPKAPPGPKHERTTVDAAHAHITGLLANPASITADSVRETVEHLASMTVKDLQTLKAKLGVKGSGTKAQLAAKIAEGALQPKAPKASLAPKAKAAPKAAAQPAAPAPVAPPAQPQQPAQQPAKPTPAQPAPAAAAPAAAPSPAPALPPPDPAKLKEVAASFRQVIGPNSSGPKDAAEAVKAGAALDGYFAERTKQADDHAAAALKAFEKAKEDRGNVFMEMVKVEDRGKEPSPELKARVKAAGEAVKAAEAAYNEARKVRGKARLAAYREALGAVREMGAPQPQEVTPGSDPEATKWLNQAMRNLPASWVRNLAAQEITIKKAPQLSMSQLQAGHWSENSQTLELGARWAAEHEIIHRVVGRKPHLGDLQLEYLKSRTKSGATQKVGLHALADTDLPKSYAYMQTVDNFDNNPELLPTAVQLLLHGDGLSQDANLRQFVFGVLGGVL